MEARVESLENTVGLMDDKINNLEQSFRGIDREVRTVREMLGVSMEQMEDMKRALQALSSGNAQIREDTPQIQTGRRSSESGREPNRFRRLEMPIFSGEDPMGWLFRMERYFTVNGVEEYEKMDAAVVCLEERTLKWYQWLETRQRVQGWPEFRRLLLSRFRNSQNKSDLEELLSIRQTSSVTDYIERFEEISAPLEGVQEAVLVSAFRNGLHADIRAELRLLKVEGLTEVLEMAQSIEERNTVIEQSRGNQMIGGTRNISGSRWVGARPIGSRVTQSTDSARVERVFQPTRPWEGRKRDDARD